MYRDGNFYDKQKSTKKRNKSSHIRSNENTSSEYRFDQFLGDVGNREIGNLFGKRFMQAKLFVNLSGDPYEREADRIAKEVVSGGSTKVDGHVKTSLVQKKGSSSGLSIDSAIERKIGNLTGKGSQLNKGLKAYLEPRFGVDLGNVRIHTGGEANRLSQAIHARAFTHGNDIAFAQGQYQPETTRGKELIAHEIAHTMQQGGAKKDVQREASSHYEPGIPDRSDIGILHSFSVPDEGIWIWYIKDIVLRVIFNSLGLSRDSSSNDDTAVMMRLSEFRKAYGIKESGIWQTDHMITRQDREMFMDIIKFRDNAQGLGLMLIKSALDTVTKEKSRYGEAGYNDELEQCVNYIQNDYKSAKTEADSVRADALIDFCKRERLTDADCSNVVDSGMGIRCKNLFLPAKQGDKKFLTRELSKSDPWAVVESMAGFIYIFCKERIDNGIGDITANAIYNKSAMDYVIGNYPDLSKAASMDTISDMKLRSSGAARFPILADVHTDFREKALMSPKDLKKFIRSLLIERESASRNSIKRLESDPELIFKFASLMKFTMDDMGIDETSRTAKAASLRADIKKTGDAFMTGFLNVLGLGLGILGFFTGGSTWAVLGLAGAGATLSGIALVREIENYSLHSDAAYSTLEFSLSEDPGALGIYLAILGLVLDVVDVAKASLSVIKTASVRLAREVDETAMRAQYALFDKKFREKVSYEAFESAVKNAKSMKLGSFMFGTHEHKVQAWFYYQLKNRDQFSILTDVIDPKWSKQYDNLVEISKFGREFQEEGLRAASCDRNTLIFVNKDSTKGFIPDGIRGNPKTVTWGNYYDFVEVKGWQYMSNTGNLRAMLDYVEKEKGTITAVFRSKAHPKGETILSLEMQRRLADLQRIGKAKIIRIP